VGANLFWLTGMVFILLRKGIVAGYSLARSKKDIQKPIDFKSEEEPVENDGSKGAT
jgi:hypothetical protein